MQGSKDIWGQIYLDYSCPLLEVKTLIVVKDVCNLINGHDRMSVAKKETYFKCTLEKG